MDIRDQPLGDFLETLADRTPAPGGGASAALHAAQAAALLAMVGRYSVGPRFAASAELIGRIVTESDELRSRALRLMAEDATAFGAVAAAYQLPKATDAEKAARTSAIGSALVEAARPPGEVIETVRRLVELAEQLLPVGNRNVITDVAAAADAARAAATTARINVEINLGDRASVDVVDEIIARTDQITSTVRQEIRR